MSATDELRRLMDERGVEWSDDGYPTTCTVWASNGIVWHGLWRDDCIELIAYLTPAQAIDATLGRGTCHAVNVAEYAWDDFECSECGWVTWNFVMEHEGCGTVQQPRYCPNCGRRVVE